jgi:hypothetical protein
MTEIWKPIIYSTIEHSYEVSNYGQIRSLNYNKTGKTKIMKLRGSPSRHLFVMLTGKIVYSVASLVIISFVSDYDKSKYVTYHINRDPADNRLENLCLISKSILNKNNGRNGHKYTKKIC